ncbi:Domain of uncharacterised function (DUF2825) [Klebsiella pneumoniae]|nr:Domain of uncharacterised function (DUF2825) [Klebsiella pneumoniae]
MAIGHAAGGGLSPLARGTHSAVKHAQSMDRFIPAGAGNTNSVDLILTDPPVYLRWRGEHILGGNQNDEVNGLSPLARGTPVVGTHVRTRHRFIPAGAGNTIESNDALERISVYPRWRGEHTSRSRVISVVRGLSPLARGTRVTLGGREIVERFIPAGAGNTKSLPLPLRLKPVYPRWRGEHINIFSQQLFRNGLSPLARGTLESKEI